MADGVLDLSSMNVAALIVKPGEVLAIIDTKGTFGQGDVESLYAYLEENAPEVKIIVVSGDGLQIAKVVKESGVLRMEKPAIKVDVCDVCGGEFVSPVELHHSEEECNLNTLAQRGRNE